MRAQLVARPLLLLALLSSVADGLLRAPALGKVDASRRAPLPAVRRAGAVRALADGGSVLGLTSSLIADAEAPGRALTEEAIKAASGDLGWWGTYIKTVEDGIFTLHDLMSDVGLPYPYALTIFSFVLGVKLLTLPLNWKQLATSAQMKAMKPQQDIVRTWYGDNKDFLNMESGLLFEKYNVNPLAGCLPSLAQIPVFLGVYYSVTSIAKAKVFTEGFLWIPSLSGPIADRREGLGWLTDNWSAGAPPLGWHDTLAYLTLPLILVCTQTAALYLLGSFEALENDDSQTSQTTGLVLRGLPFMLGWFAMNAPAGLGLYWVFNNILTTTSTLVVKKLVEAPPIDVKVDLASLGPRQAPRPLFESGSAPEWIPKSTPTLDEAAEGGEAAETAKEAEAAESSAV